MNLTKQVLVASAIIFVNVSMASNDATSSMLYRGPRLTEVKMSGVLKCANQEHDSEQDCALEFVDGTSGEKWSVRKNPALEKTHALHEGGFQVSVTGKRSPRYLLGGSYLVISSYSYKKPMQESSKGQF
jgi:hypothetical protein